MHDDADHTMMMPKPESNADATGERSRVHSKANQAPEFLGDTRTTNARHR